MTLDDKKKIKQLFSEISGSKDRIKGEQDLQKAALESIADELQIDRGQLKRAADIYHRQNYVQKQTEIEEVFELVDAAIS